MRRISPSQKRLVLHHLITIRENERSLFWASYRRHRRELSKWLSNPFLVAANLAEHDVVRARKRKYNLN